MKLNQNKLLTLKDGYLLYEWYYYSSLCNFEFKLLIVGTLSGNWMNLSKIY